jgi:hypothetical protein
VGSGLVCVREEKGDRRRRRPEREGEEARLGEAKLEPPLSQRLGAGESAPYTAFCMFVPRSPRRAHGQGGRERRRGEARRGETKLEPPLSQRLGAGEGAPYTAFCVFVSCSPWSAPAGDRRMEWVGDGTER